MKSIGLTLVYGAAVLAVGIIGATLVTQRSAPVRTMGDALAVSASPETLRVRQCIRGGADGAVGTCDFTVAAKDFSQLLRGRPWTCTNEACDATVVTGGRPRWMHVTITVDPTHTRGKVEIRPQSRWRSF